MKQKKIKGVKPTKAWGVYDVKEVGSEDLMVVGIDMGGLPRRYMSSVTHSIFRHPKDAQMYADHLNHGLHTLWKAKVIPVLITPLPKKPRRLKKK